MATKVKFYTYPNYVYITTVIIKETVWTKAFNQVRKDYPQHKDATLVGKPIKCK